MQQRSYWVDYAKAIGIVLVVYGHVARGVHSAGVPMDEGVFRLVDSIIYSFHMPLFFFLSGLFFYDTLGKRGPAGLVLNKIDTVVYPFVIWSLLQGFVEVALARYANFGASLGDVLAFAWHPRAQFWFLYALFCIFVLCTLLYSQFSRALTLPFLLLFGGLFVVRDSLHWPQIPDFVIGNAVFFVLGVWFDEVKDVFRQYRRTLLIVFAAAFVAMQYVFHISLGLTYESGGMPGLVLAIVSVLFVVALALCLDQVPMRWLAYLGTSSMAIYVMHVLAGSGTRIFLARVLGIETPSVHLLLGTLVGIVAPLLALALIQRWKMDWLFVAPRSFGLAGRFGRRANG